ncbi:3D domain-containing protein [Peptacetobacter sp.]|uniref:3D domain-containing protein n=1 Tax=Peptacetobacter sp. TaxID=2991975 RepID=UPI00262EFDF3|nr:3D domain-containing protein [Peptacetobacter sp.]
MLNLKKKISSIALISMMLLSSNAVAFADESIDNIEMVSPESSIERVEDNDYNEVERKSTDSNTGVWEIKNKSFYYRKNGEVKPGWQNVDGNTYYFYKDGKMADGWTTIDKKTYFFNREEGKHTGIRTLSNGKTYNFGNDGSVSEGIVKTDGKILYFNERGKLTSTGKSYKSNASAYSGHTKTSTGQKPRFGTIAVDPKVIPYGSKVYIPYFNKVFIANDCGGAIKGTKIDIFMNSSRECYKFGRRNIEIIVLKDINAKK